MICLLYLVKKRMPFDFAIKQLSFISSQDVGFFYFFFSNKGVLQQSSFKESLLFTTLRRVGRGDENKKKELKECSPLAKKTPVSV